MDKALEFVAETFLFLAFLCLIVDIGNYRMAKEQVKDALDISTKAAALQIDQTPSKIAQGKFEIDDITAKAVFINMMSKNLKTSQDTIKNCMIEYKAINIPRTYMNPGNNKTYNIEYPTFVAPMRFKYTGILIKKDLIITNNFAGSQLKPKE